MEELVDGLEVTLTVESVLATVSQPPRVSVSFTQDGYSTG